jgi:hypothetical protein
MYLKIDFFLYSCSRINMAKQVFESLDLVRHIFSYGPEHREKLARVHERLKYPTEKDLRIHNVFMGYEVNRACVVQYFMDVRCRCCSRHSHRKSYPVITNRILCFAPAYAGNVPEEKNLYDCDCLCRHYTRTFIKSILTYER